MLTKTPIGIILLTFIILMAVFFLGKKSGAAAEEIIALIHKDLDAGKSYGYASVYRIDDGKVVCYTFGTNISCVSKK